MAKISSMLGAAAVCCALCGPAAAQESLLDIYRRALENDPLIREAEATYLATAEVRPQARSQLLPSLNLGATRTHQFRDTLGGGIDPTTGQVFGDRQKIQSYNTGMQVSLTQTLFNWADYATLRQADKRVTQAETQFRLAQQELLLRVGEAYFDVLAAEDTLAAAVVTREARARQLEQAQRRFEVGLIAITDVQEFQAGYDQAVAAEIAAQRVLSTAQEFLREIIGEGVTDLAAPIDELPLLRPDPEDAEAWVRTALDQNLALISSRIAADIAQDSIDINRAARLPTVSLSATYSEAEQDQLFTIFNQPPVPDIVRPTTSEPDSRNWQLSVQFPLYAGGFNRSRIQQSVYQHRAARETLERVARQTERQARDAYLGVISEISRVRALQQAVESSRTALRAGEAGFEVGTRTVVDVLTLQDNLQQAETTYARSRYDYILNLLRLKQAAGNLTVADIELVDSWLQQ